MLLVGTDEKILKDFLAQYITYASNIVISSAEDYPVSHDAIEVLLIIQVSKNLFFFSFFSHRQLSDCCYLRPS